MTMKTPKPLLFVDVDGVISTYGFAGNGGVPSGTRPIGSIAAGGVAGKLHNVEGIIHHIGQGMDLRLAALLPHFETVWATGWGDRANEHLVHLLSLPCELEVVEFGVAPSMDGSGHWKLDALTARAAGRAAAWIDDGHNAACELWAAERSRRDEPTLLISTDPFAGLTDDHVTELIAWSRAVARV
jgi:hypothetical protein